jgi:hypothetical protein
MNHSGQKRQEAITFIAMVASDSCMLREAHFLRRRSVAASCIASRRLVVSPICFLREYDKLRENQEAKEEATVLKKA